MDLKAIYFVRFQNTDSSKADPSDDEASLSTPFHVLGPRCLDKLPTLRETVLSRMLSREIQFPPPFVFGPRHFVLCPPNFRWPAWETSLFPHHETLWISGLSCCALRRVLVKSIVVFMTLSSYGFDLRALATGRGRECIWAKYAYKSAARNRRWNHYGR